MDIFRHRENKLASPGILLNNENLITQATFLSLNTFFFLNEEGLSC